MSIEAWAEPSITLELMLSKMSHFNIHRRVVDNGTIRCSNRCTCNDNDNNIMYDNLILYLYNYMYFQGSATKNHVQDS